MEQVQTPGLIIPILRYNKQRQLYLQTGNRFKQRGKSESELVIHIVSIPKVVPIKLLSFRSLPVSEIPEGSSSSQSCDANFTHVTAHAAVHGFSSSTKTFTLRAW